MRGKAMYRVGLVLSFLLLFSFGSIFLYSYFGYSEYWSYGEEPVLKGDSYVWRNSLTGISHGRVFYRVELCNWQGDSPPPIKREKIHFREKESFYLDWSQFSYHSGIGTVRHTYQPSTGTASQVNFCRIDKFWSLPLWPLIALGGLLPARLAVRAFKVWHRANKGHCTNCGYDLRASSGYCPECGTVEPRGM